MRAVAKPNYEILYTLMGLAQAHGKNYCYPSQITLLELVRRFTGRIMSRRTLNRHLAAIEGQGLLIRQRRHTRTRDGGLWLKSTLYKFTVITRGWADRLGKTLGLVLRLGRVPLVAQNGNPILSSRELSTGRGEAAPSRYEKTRRQ